MEARSPPGWRWQRPVGILLCGLETMLCPHAVLVKGVATPVRLARSRQAQERGSARLLSAPIAMAAGARAGVRSQHRALGEHADAYRRVQGCSPTGQRTLIPGCSLRVQ